MALINYKCAKCGMITVDAPNETSSCTVTNQQSDTPNDHEWVAATNDENTSSVNSQNTGKQNADDGNASAAVND